MVKPADITKSSYDKKTRVGAPKVRGSGGTKDEAVYKKMFKAIVERRLAPGRHLSEDALSETFGVSRTVIRKVLQRLSVEKLVTTYTNRGAFVCEPTEQESRDVFQARRVLELGAFSLIEPKLTCEHILHLKEVVELEKEARLREDKEQEIWLSGEFHKRLVAIAGNQELNSLLTLLISRSSLIMTLYGVDSCAHKRDCHAEIVEALERGDLKHVLAILTVHLSELEQEFSCLKNHSSDDFERIFNV